jgi:pyrimidine oxygenase
MAPKDIDIGVFIPIGNNGWLISTTAPQYKPSFELNKAIVQKAEQYDFNFALSMIKLRGFGGKTEHWDHNLESFTLMAGLAAVTSKIKLFASTAILTLPPAVAARMATTIDSIAPGRFGINIVTGWQTAEYEQMSLWPGPAYFGYRYKYATEYVQVMKDLWNDGKSDLKGEHFKMEDCRMLPKPSSPIKIVAAGQSPSGLKFAAEHCDYNFTAGSGHNTPTAFADNNKNLVEAAKTAGRDVGAIVLFMIIAYETDEAAEAKWQLYKDGIDEEAVGWLQGQGKKDEKADATATVARHQKKEGAVNFNCGTLIGSYEKVASMLDEIAEQPIKGIMLTFDDFLVGIENFGTRIQPLMKSRTITQAAQGIEERPRKRTRRS